MLGVYSSHGISGTPTNYARLGSPSIILCSVDSVESQFRVDQRESYLYECVF